MLDLNKKTVLITGGTGLLGHSFIRSLLQRFPGVEKVLIFSRDEQKQYKMAQIFSETPYRCLQYILGDIKDLKGLELALKGVDYVVHAAALKRVPASEYHPSQFIQTNISGTENLIYAALQHKVKAVIGISTDKAVEPASTYGATKLCMEKLLVQANFLQYNDKATPTAFSVVRLGNLLGARGSAVPAFLQSRSKGVISLMDADSSRFHITPQGAADCRQEIIGLRPGEKMHETMISGTEAHNIPWIMVLIMPFIRLYLTGRSFRKTMLWKFRQIFRIAQPRILNGFLQKI